MGIFSENNPVAIAFATINNYTDDRTLTLADNGCVVVMDKATAVTVTVPASLGAGFNCLILQKGAGQVALAASGTTINNRQSFTKAAGQYAIITLLAYAANVFVSSGDMAT